MLARKAIIVSSWLIVAIVCVALCGCAKPPAQPVPEQPPDPQKIAALSPPQQPSEMPKLPPPNLQEVQEAAKRIFKDAVVIDASRSPNFLVGDFNGDQSEDIAIVVKPAEGKLSELNQEYPNWLAREPMEEIMRRSNIMNRPASAKPSPNPAAGQTIRFKQSDVLLAIIHGVGPKGWHDAEATQTHLLRDVVGANIRTLPYKSVVKAYKGARPFPTIYGDLIQETLLGQSGFIHFAGGVYDWYDPKNYKQVIVPAHSMASVGR